MRRFLVALVGVCLVLPVQFTTPAAAQGISSCADFDAWEWAQSVFDADPQRYEALDPDGGGEACPDLPHGGFAPAFWTDTVPVDAEAAQIKRVIDGDTFEMTTGTDFIRVHLYRADAPEAQNDQECGGREATLFATSVLGFNSSPNVFLEKDTTAEDSYGRELAYVWFEIDGRPYLLNHILLTSGWADDVVSGDRKYDTELKDAAAFSKRHALGVWATCGGFGMPLATPSR